MSWKHHKSKEKHIIGANKIITEDITVQNLVKSQGIFSNSFNGSGVLQSHNAIIGGSDFKVISSKALMEFLRNNTLPSFGSDPCGHWFRTISEGQVKGNIIFPSQDLTNTEKGWKIGAYNNNYVDIEGGEGILEFISDVSFAKNIYVGHPMIMYISATFTDWHNIEKRLLDHVVLTQNKRKRRIFSSFMLFCNLGFNVSLCR